MYIYIYIYIMLYYILYIYIIIYIPTIHLLAYMTQQSWVIPLKSYELTSTLVTVSTNVFLSNNHDAKKKVCWFLESPLTFFVISTTEHRIHQVNCAAT